MLIKKIISFLSNVMVRWHRCCKVLKQMLLSVKDLLAIIIYYDMSASPSSKGEMS